MCSEPIFAAQNIYYEGSLEESGGIQHYTSG